MCAAEMEGKRQFSIAISLDLFVCIILTPCSAHVGDLGTDRSMLTENNAPLIRQTAKDFYMHYHMDVITHGMPYIEPVGSTGWSKMVTLSE